MTRVDVQYISFEMDDGIIHSFDKCTLEIFDGAFKIIEGDGKYTIIQDKYVKVTRLKVDTREVEIKGQGN